MELFKISNGPWETLFEGLFQGQRQMGVYTNPKSEVLVAIFEMDGKKTIGAVIEIYKSFFAQGEIEAFAESLPRELVLLTKHNEKETLKFLLLSSNPVYVDWKEDTVIQEVDRLLSKIDTSAGILSEISKAYNITLEEISKAKPNMKKAFFSMPMLVPVISTKYNTTETMANDMPVSYHEFLVGMTREKTKIVEPITVFAKTIVVNGNKGERHHTLQLLSEGFLLSGASVMIFDFEKQFQGLKTPATNTQDFEKYEVESEPIGFPVRVFLPYSDLKIDLNFIDPYGFGEAFGFGSSKSVEIVANTILKNKVTGMKELIKKIKEQKDYSEYDTCRTARILGLLAEIYPQLFEGTNSIEELATKKVKALGRGSILDLSGLDERARVVLAHNILSALIDFFSKNQKQKGLSAVVVLPQAKDIVTDKYGSVTAKELSNMFSKLENYGVGYLLSNDGEVDFPEVILQNSDAQLSMIKGNDCAVQLRGKKSYRVLLRPTLSSMGQMEKQKTGLF